MTTVDVVADGTDISAFEETWEDLYAEPGNEPSTSFEWTAALLRHHVQLGDRVVLLRAARGSDAIALVPLVARTFKLFGLPVVMLFPIAERYNTHSDVLTRAFDEEVARALMGSLDRLNLRWDVFRMSKVLDDHALVRCVESGALPRGQAWCLRPTHGSYHQLLDATYDGYLAGRSAKFRNHLRRTEKRLEGSHDVQVADVWSPADVDLWYERLLDVERASWKQAQGTSISAIARQTGFYRDLCLGAAARGRLRLHFLMLNGEAVAYNLGYVKDRCYFYLKTSCVEQHKKLGIATYLRARLVEGLIASGVRTMDFPAEPYDWESQWADTVRGHRVLTRYRRTTAGYGLLLADRMRNRAARARAVEAETTR